MRVGFARPGGNAYQDRIYLDQYNNMYVHKLSFRCLPGLAIAYGRERAVIQRHWKSFLHVLRKLTAGAGPCRDPFTVQSDRLEEITGQMAVAHASGEG